MRKFSKLIESVKYTEEDIEDFFLPLLDVGAKLKIYDGYYKPGLTSSDARPGTYPTFYSSLSKIDASYKDAKMVIINFPIITKHISIDFWSEIQNNSRFNFQSKQDFIKYRQIINEVFSCLRHIEYDYFVELEQSRIKIILIGDSIDDTLVNLSDKNKRMYEYLYGELIKLTDIFKSGEIYKTSLREAGVYYVNYDTQFYPILTIGYRAYSKVTKNILASILKFNIMYDDYFNRENVKVLPSIVDIVKKIDDEGFQISIKDCVHSDNTYEILITPKK